MPRVRHYLTNVLKISDDQRHAWIPLRPPDFYTENAIELRLAATATVLDVAGLA
ncbi:MAG: hypothetical protein WA709_37790 [Stellaceae bacterium]